MTPLAISALASVVAPCFAKIVYSTDARCPKKTSPFKTGLTKTTVCLVRLNFHMESKYISICDENGYCIDGPQWQVNTDTNPLAEHCDSQEPYCRVLFLQKLDTKYYTPEGNAVGESEVVPFLPKESEKTPVIRYGVIKLSSLREIVLLSDDEYDNLAG